MRIASTQFHATMNSALQNATYRVETVLQKMASGARYLLPSEGPVAHVRLARLEREEATLDQYRDNIANLQSRMSQDEALLDSITSDMLSMRDLLVWAADGANTSDDVTSMAASMQPIMDSLFYTANSRDAEGRYLFSGTATDTPALSYDPSAPAGFRYTFTGNEDVQLVVVGEGVTQPANLSLPELADLLNQLDNARESLSVPGVNVNDPAVRTVLTTALDGLDVAIDSVSGRIAALGGAQNILETLEANHGNISLSNQQAALTIGQLDYADAAVKLNGYMAAVQATQKAYSAVSKLSLFDVI